MGFLENIHASCKLVIKTNGGHHKNRFKPIIEGGSRLKCFKIEFKSKEHRSSINFKVFTKKECNKTAS